MAYKNFPCVSSRWCVIVRASMPRFGWKNTRTPSRRRGGRPQAECGRVRRSPVYRTMHDFVAVEDDFFFLLFYFSASLVLSYNCHRVLTHTPLAFLAIVISSRHCLLCRRRRHHHRVIIVVVVVHVVIFFLSSFERRSPSILRRLFEQFFSQCIF